MSHDVCKYCGGYAFKTNGSGEFVCQDHANTGTCDPEQPGRTVEELKEIDMHAFDGGQSIRQVRRSSDRKKKGKRKYGFK